MTEPELLTVEEAARALSVGRSTLYGWIADGLVPTFRVKRIVRIPRAALEAIVEARTDTHGKNPAVRTKGA